MNYLYAPLLYVCYIQRYVCLRYYVGNNNCYILKQKTIIKEIIALLLTEKAINF